MKKVLKLLSVVFVCTTLVSLSACPTCAVIMLGVDVLMRPQIAAPGIGVPNIGFPGILDPTPMIAPNAQLQQMKYNPDKGGRPVAERNEYDSKKEAREDAQRAGKGKKPIHHPHGHEKNKTPHYHPDVKGPARHDHYYYHRVVVGETLGGIAKKYGTTYQEIAKLNGISDPNKISVGQNLKIPNNSAGNAQLKNSAENSGYQVYTVKSGDTLGTIAKRFNTTYQKIAEFNGISNPNRINVGQNLKIPK